LTGVAGSVGAAVSAFVVFGVAALARLDWLIRGLQHR
jgi:hypothetical protein